MERVVDGDTIRVHVDRSEAVRLIGIDTPETVDPRRPTQCFGPEASARAHQLLDDQQVWLEFDPTQDRRDRYGRLLAYVWLDDTTMANEVLVRTGYAHEYTYNTKYKYQDAFIAAEHTAHAASLGLWAPNTCAGGAG